MRALLFDEGECAARRSVFHNLSTGKDANRAAAHAFCSSAATETAVVCGTHLQAWRAARTVVKSVERLIVIRYSLPDADHLVRALFRADIDNDRP